MTSDWFLSGARLHRAARPGTALCGTPLEGSQQLTPADAADLVRATAAALCFSCERRTALAGRPAAERPATANAADQMRHPSSPRPHLRVIRGGDDPPSI